MSKGFYFSRAWSISKKEFRHFIRDPFTLALALGVPMMLVIFFGYSIDFNVKDVQLVSVDQDHSRASRQLLDIINSTQYIQTEPLAPGENMLAKMDREEAKGTMIIQPRFGRHLGQSRPSQVQILLDGADNASTGIILSYLAGIEKSAQAQLLGHKLPEPVAVKARYLFNPELNSKWFVVPGLIVVVIGIFSILLTALTVAREWETGSMELLLSTPVRPLEIIVGKLTPYFGLVSLNVFVIYLIARLQFGLPFRGSHWLFILGASLFLIMCLAQGLVISVLTRQQQLAMQLALITGMLPTFLLSGFIFPIESMPSFFQYLTYILAPRWFMVISRGLFLKGAGLQELAQPLLMLLIISSLIVAVALKRFKKDLEP